MVLRETTNNEWGESFLLRRKEPFAMMQLIPVRRGVRKSAEFSLMIIALGDGRYETYVSHHLNIGICTLDILNIPERKSNR